MNKLLNCKIIAVILAGIIIVSLFSNIFNVVFAIDNAIIQLNGMSEMDAGYAVYKDGNNNIIGRIIGIQSLDGFSDNEGDVGTIASSAGSNKFEWQGLEAGTYKFKAEVDSGYTLQVMAGGSTIIVDEVENEDNMYVFEITVTDGNIVIIDPSFNTNTPPPPGGDPQNPPQPEPFVAYDVIAYFEGISTGVVSDFESNILMPEGWTEGQVEFFCRTCKVNGELKPYYDGMQCDENSYEEIRLDIEGIANGAQINRTVQSIGTYGNMKAIFTEAFQNYGKATFHLANAQGMNLIVKVNTEDLIFIKAEAELEMSYSLGSAAIDNAILTNKQTGDVSIFFGNTATTIRAEGTKVSKITQIVGGQRVEYNENGTVTVTLPPLSTETTTRLIVTIELTDGISITKNINVIRTAIELGFNRADGNATLEAGYVVNKAYLYNNQIHNDSIFDAYLQVILYKDGVVAGYKQVKIDDSELINSLQNNQSGSMELVSDNHINLYGKELNDTIDGVNSASVFLTNGPIDFDSDTLPSVEFGIGSGVTINFGGEE